MEISLTSGNTLAFWPWQNGKCEIHGCLVKDLLAKGLETEVVVTPDDLEDLVAETVSQTKG